ncbi:MAG: DsbA family protein [Pseudomonadales bacterium]|nr:DsbA family protein [Pseudomonadales bacterium]
MNNTVIIDYYSDILCVWAWIAQRRIDELNKTLGDQIELHYYYVDIFGDVRSKMETQWQQRNGYIGFAEHVRKSASGFEDAPVNAKIWTEVKPATSANAHMVLKAIELVYGKQKSIDMALIIREAFYVDAQDIGDLGVLYELLQGHSIDPKDISAMVTDGSAIAALMHDYQKSKQQGIKGSPSYVMDGGRQTLYGNVGYRVLHANIEELLKNPVNEASWC